MRYRILILAGLLAASPSLWGAEQQYGARLNESNWKVASSRLSCSLSHHIPEYGTATFQARAGQPITFHMHVKRKPVQGDVARLRSVPPAWMHQAVMRDLGQVPVVRGDTPFTFHQALARRLLVELENGRIPTLTYRDWADGRDEVTVALSAVNFRKGLTDFLSCVNELLPYQFKDVKESHLAFAFGETELNSRARRRLDQVAEYLSADKTVRRIELQGSTDSIGYRYYNRKLGQKRAKAVQQYLVAKGVPESLFKVVSTGERDPVASNGTKSGRAKNRRVDVVLLH